MDVNAIYPRLSDKQFQVLTILNDYGRKVCFHWMHCLQTLQEVDTC